MRKALQYKVSRDAIGSAIDEMLGTRARDPSRGIQLLMATNLIDVVFPLGGKQDDDGDGGDNIMESTTIGDIVESMTMSTPTTMYRAGLACLLRTQSLVTRIFLQSDFEWDITKRRFLWYAALFKPVYEMMPTPTTKSKRGRRQGVFYQLLDDALRRPKTDIQSIETILKGVDPIQMMLLEEAHYDAMQSALYSEVFPKDDDAVSTTIPIHDFFGWGDFSEIRWSIYRALKPIGPLWKEALILALACSPHKTLADCVAQYKDLALLIEDRLQLGALLLDKPKPLLNGSQIQKLLGQIDGRGFKHVAQAIEEWQIRNVFHDLDGIGNGERNRMETELIDYLVTTFPEYANSTSIT